MFWTKNKASTRKVILSVAVLCLAAVALITGAQFNSTDASTAVTTSTLAGAAAAAPDATFPGTGVGAIPDGNAGTPPQFGTPLVVSFAVSGVTGNVTNVTVDMTLTHTWVGDVDVVLRAPGGSPSLVVVSRIGVTTATSFGSPSDYSGLYTFTDAAAGTNIWTAAAATPVPAGSYRTTAPGQAGQTNPAPVTSLNTTFGGLTPAQANGTWTLTFRDAASADIGTVTAANLTVQPTGVAPPADAPIDYNNDGRTDYVVVRNVGGGAGGQIRWFYNLSSGGATVAKDWGLSTDKFISGDWDNDGNDDIAIWRPGAATVAAFYVLRSSDFSALIEPFGQATDDPTIVDDYNNDGRTDFAVFRAGANPGDQSTWFYKTAQGGPTTYVPWGVNGDFPVPGDWDGDGNADFMVQRNAGGGNASFWRRLSTGAVAVYTYGGPTDNVLPGDYDGDGKDDIAIARGVGGSWHWYYLRSIDNVSVGPITFGLSATDFLCQGDWDGDGKIEPGIWRGTDGTFVSLNSSNGQATFFHLGQPGDYPVNNFNRH